MTSHADIWLELLCIRDPAKPNQCISFIYALCGPLHSNVSMYDIRFYDVYKLKYVEVKVH